MRCLLSSVDQRVPSPGDSVLISTLGTSAGVVVQALYGLMARSSPGLRVDHVDQVVTTRSSPHAWPHPNRLDRVRQALSQRPEAAGWRDRLLSLLESASTHQLLEQAGRPLADLTDENWRAARQGFLELVELRRRQIGPTGRLFLDFTGGRVGMSYFLALAGQLLGAEGDCLIYTNVEEKGRYLMDDGSSPYVPREPDDIFFVRHDLARLSFLQTLASWSGGIGSTALTDDFAANLRLLETYTLLGVHAAGLAHDGVNLARQALAASSRAGRPRARSGQQPIERLDQLLSSFDTLRRQAEGVQAGSDSSRFDLAAAVRTELAYVAQRHRRCGKESPSILRAGLGRPCEVYGDDSAVRQALGLLLDNAFKHAAPAGAARVAVRLRPAGSRVLLELANSGEPMPPELVPYALLPAKPGWLMARQRLRESSGRGVGLAVANQLLAAQWESQDLAEARAGGALVPIELSTDAELGGLLVRVTLQR